MPRNIERPTYPTVTTFRKKNFKRYMTQFSGIAREILTIYSLVKTKNPLSIGLGVVSSIGMIYDNLNIGDNINIALLKKKGYESFNDMDSELIYNTLKHIGLEENVLMKHEENDTTKIVEFLIEDIEILFYLNESDIYGPFLKNKEEFIKAFSKFIFDKLGNIIKIESKMDDNREVVKFSSLDIGTKIYISSINEEKLVEKLQLFKSKGFSRSLLFYGPPGVGKTTLVGRLVKKMEGKLIVLHPDIIDNIEMSIISIINLLNPDVILFDDIDRITEFNDTLAYLEELNKSKNKQRLIIGTVNDLYLMPSPMKRPGRFDQIIEFYSPTEEQIAEMIIAYAKEYNVSFTEEGFIKIKRACHKLTPAYINEIVKRRLVETEEDLLEQIGHIHKFLETNMEDEKDPNEK